MYCSQILFATFFLIAYSIEIATAGDPCGKDMTSDKWKQFDNCAKDNLPDFDKMTAKFDECYKDNFSADRPKDFDTMKTTVCKDENQAKREKFNECTHSGKNVAMKDFTPKMKECLAKN